MGSSRPIIAIAEAFATAHPQAAAQALAGLPAAEAADFFERCPAQLAASVAGGLSAHEWVACLRALTIPRGAEVLAEMPVERVAATLRRLTADERSAFRELLPTQKARRVQNLLRYEEGSAGALMEPAVLTVRAERTAGEVLDSLGRDPSDLRYYLYAVDGQERLIGVLDLRRLMHADPKASVAGLMTKEVQRIPARARREAILRHPGWDAFHALPVVDQSNVLVGVLSYGTVRRLARLDREARSTPSSVLGSLGDLYWSGSQRVAAELLAMTRRVG